MKIISSARIDFCSQCGKEHGYDCPLDIDERKRKIYNRFVPKFLRHFRAKYICGWLGWHKTPNKEMAWEKYSTFTCTVCGCSIENKGYKWK